MNIAVTPSFLESVFMLDVKTRKGVLNTLKALETTGISITAAIAADSAEDKIRPMRDFTNLFALSLQVSISVNRI